MTKKLKFKIPKTLGACADLLYTTRKDRLELQKQVDDLKKQEGELKEHIIQNLPKSSATGVSGKVANAKVTKTDKPTVEDWDKIYKYIKKNNAFELMQRRLNTKSVEERWEDGKKIPGVGKMTVVDVSSTKV